MGTGKPVVFIVDDQQEIRKHVQTYFELAGYRVEMASTIKGAINLILKRELSGEIIWCLIDWKMREAETPPLFSFIKRNAPHRVIASAYTADGSVATHMRARAAGAKHFFVKDLPLDVIQGYMEEDYGDVKDYTFDDLTGLLNFRGFRQHLASEMRQAKTRPEMPSAEFTSMLFIDIDSFKSGINDKYGHEFGDRAIKTVADVLRKHTRPADHVCRIYGDEFGVVLALDEKRARDKAAELKAEVASAFLFTDENDSVPLSISVGVSTIQRSEIDDDIEKTIAQLIKTADLRMFEDKGPKKRS